MANAVKEWRARVGITQDQASKRLGITLRNYQAYEASAYVPPVSVRKLMRAVVLGLDLAPWPVGDDVDAEKNGSAP